MDRNGIHKCRKEAVANQIESDKNSNIINSVENNRCHRHPHSLHEQDESFQKTKIIDMNSELKFSKRSNRKSESSGLGETNKNLERRKFGFLNLSKEVPVKPLGSRVSGNVKKQTGGNPQHKHMKNRNRLRYLRRQLKFRKRRGQIAQVRRETLANSSSSPLQKLLQQQRQHQQQLEEQQLQHEPHKQLTDHLQQEQQQQQKQKYHGQQQHRLFQRQSLHQSETSSNPSRSSDSSTQPPSIPSPGLPHQPDLPNTSFDPIPSPGPSTSTGRNHRKDCSLGFEGLKRLVPSLCGNPYVSNEDVLNDTTRYIQLLRKRIEDRFSTPEDRQHAEDFIQARLAVHQARLTKGDHS